MPPSLDPPGQGKPGGVRRELRRGQVGRRAAGQVREGMLDLGVVAVLFFCLVIGELVNSGL